jgi:hypothetical protein
MVVGVKGSFKKPHDGITEGYQILLPSTSLNNEI